jgi:hypothetical protein
MLDDNSCRIPPADGARGDADVCVAGAVHQD